MTKHRLYRFIKNMKFQEFLRFSIVGGVCTLIDACVFYLLYRNYGYRLAISAGFVASISVNYILNVYWSFKEKPTIKNAIGLLMAHVFNIFVIRMSLMWLFIDLIKLPESIAYVPTLLISIITNFIIIRFIVKHIN